MGHIPPGLYYALLFIAFVAEGTSFPLIHIPAMVMFLTSAYLVTLGKISLVAAILVAAAGSTAGGFVTYLLGGVMSSRNGKAGETAGEAAVGPERSLRGFLTSPERLASVHRLAARYGALLALAARWLGILRPAALLGTGMARVSPWKVLPALFVGSLTYCTVYQLVAEGLEAISLRLLGQVDLELVLLSALGLALAWAGSLYLLRRCRF